MPGLPPPPYGGIVRQKCTDHFKVWSGYWKGSSEEHEIDQILLKQTYQIKLHNTNKIFENSHRHSKYPGKCHECIWLIRGAGNLWNYRNRFINWLALISKYVMSTLLSKNCCKVSSSSLLHWGISESEFTHKWIDCEIVKIKIGVSSNVWERKEMTILHASYWYRVIFWIALFHYWKRYCWTPCWVEL